MTTTDIDSADDASGKEIERYENAYRATRRTLDEAIETLMILEEFEDTSVGRRQLALDRGELEDERAALVRANIAFHTQQATMTPPSPGLVNQIIEISKRAVELTVERATASAALALATSALRKFAQIQDLS